MKLFVLPLFLISLISQIHVSAQLGSPLQIAEESEIDLNSFTGILLEKYRDGRPKLHKTLKEGKANGLWLEWYPNGQLRYRAYWKDNKGHGLWEYFYPNGALRSESFYINDIAQGIYRGYYSNGQLQSTVTYLNGRKEGIEQNFDKAGIVISEILFRNGQEKIHQPRLFEPGLISTATNHEWGISFAPDNSSAYFTRRDAETGLKRIYMVEKEMEGWSVPKIASFSTGEDEGVYVHSDGSIYFASFRNLPGKPSYEKNDNNLWVVNREGDRLLEPQPLSPIINKHKKADNFWMNGYEAGPFMDSDNNLYYWTQSSKKQTSNLFMASYIGKGTFRKPKELLPPSNHRYFDSAPCVSPDGKVLVFSSDNRPDGFGGADLYYSLKTQEGWSQPLNFGPVLNTSFSEGNPSFSPDGTCFFFSSTRGLEKDANGELIWSLYYLESEFLFKAP